MLDIGWPELTVILVVALLVIGPRDLPKALHAVGKWVRKARSVTREFQRHIDDMVREADIEEVKQLRQHAGKFSKAGMTRELDKMIDPSGEMRQSMDVKKAFAGKPDEADDGSAEAAADGQAVAADAATGKGAQPKTDGAPKIEAKPAVPMGDPGATAADREAQAIIDAKLKAAAEPARPEPARRSVGPRRTRSFTRAAREKREAEAAAADPSPPADAKPKQPRAAKPKGTASRAAKPRAVKEPASKEPAAKETASKATAKKPAAKKPAAKKPAANRDSAAAKTAAARKAPGGEVATPKRRTRRTPAADKQGGAESAADQPAVSAEPAATGPSSGAAAPGNREG